MLPQFLDSILQLITKTSTDLPPDVRAAMGAAVRTEEPATRAGQALTIIAQNIDLAASCDGPICQDTGMPTFEVKVPVGANQISLRQQIRDAASCVRTQSIRLPAKTPATTSAPARRSFISINGSATPSR